MLFWSHPSRTYFSMHILQLKTMHMAAGFLIELIQNRVWHLTEKLIIVMERTVCTHENSIQYSKAQYTAVKAWNLNSMNTGVMFARGLWQGTIKYEQSFCPARRICCMEVRWVCKRYRSCHQEPKQMYSKLDSCFLLFCTRLVYFFLKP